MDKPLTLKSARSLTLRYKLPISRTRKFWEKLKEGKVYATKCGKCGKLYFPPVADCGKCGASSMEWIELDGEGELVTFTQVFVKPPSFSDESDYIVGIARLKEGVNALAWLVGVEREKIRLGMKVRLVAEVSAEGRPSYHFVAV